MTAEYTRIHPAIGRVAIELLTQEDRTESGIFLPFQRDQVATNVGRVVAICDAYKSSGGEEGPMYLLGSVVVFGKYIGSQIQIRRRDVIVMREQDILCTLYEEESDATEAAGSTAGIIPIRG